MHPMLQPYQPSAKDPFDHVKAAHLLGRCGFGGTDEEVRKAIQLGPAGAVDWLLDFPNASAEEQNKQDVPDLSAIKGLPASFRALRRQFAGKSIRERKQAMKMLRMANRQAFMAAWDWWMKRMAGGPHPLQEKLTLFWHGHFTTSFRDERLALLVWEQNELLRRQSAGNFRTLLHAISRDPAMLDYLNNEQNRKGHPNENYAREVMELFTLGIGNYTEDDVKQGARAFTGWTHDGLRFVFNRRQHDYGVKRFLGTIGDLNGDDVLEVIVSKAACSTFIVSELFAYFAYPDPEPAIVDDLARQFRESKFELRPLLKTMLRSRAFYGANCMGVQIKSPVQLVVGTVRMLGAPMPPARMMFGALQLMGQVPMMPPNVRGWPGGRSWINASTLFMRYNAAVRLAAGKIGLDGLTEDGPETAVDALVDRLIGRPIGPDRKRVLLDAYRSRPKAPQAIREVCQLIVSMPEYQLC